jgi:hypothetical protein
MLMECENCPEMNHAGHSGGQMDAALAEPLLVAAWCAKRDKFNIRAGRYLPLLQDAGRCAGCHAGRHRRVSVLAAEEIAAHGEARVALALLDLFAGHRLVELLVLHDRQFQIVKILEHIERLLLRGSGRRDK